MCSISRWARPSTSASLVLVLALWRDVRAAEPKRPAAPAQAAAPAAANGRVAAPPTTPAAFAEAMDAVRRGDAADTARLCWSYLSSKDRDPGEAGLSDKLDSAGYYLGEALEKLGYVHAAIDRYLDIVTERRAPQLVPRALAALERLARTRSYDAEEIAYEGVLTVAEFEELPERLSSFVHYLQAVDDLRRGYDSWAAAHFGKIRDDTPYVSMALYARAVWHLARGDGDAALADLNKAIAHPQAPPDIKARALHSRGRIYYDRGLYAEAYADLDKVDTRYEPGGDVLLEKAWTRYRAKDYRTSLGLLHALGAPSYVGRFAPEQYLLRSLIFSKFCHFRTAKRSIEQFREHFVGEIAALRGGRHPAEVEPLRQAAFERSAVTGAGAVHAILEELRAERERVGAFGSWGSPKDARSLNGFLASFYDFRIQGTGHREQRLLRPAVEGVANELLGANEQMNLLEYEVGLGIYRRIGREARLKEPGPKSAIPRVSEPTYFHFDDEYWTDELPDMQFFIEDRCVD